MNETLPDNQTFRLPKGWAWTTIGDLKLFSLYGPRFSSEDYSEQGIAVLRTTDISDSGKVSLEKAPKINLSEADYEKYKVEIGDLLITRTGSIGTLAVFNDKIRAIPGAYLIQYRLLNNGISSWYLFYFLNSSNGQKQLLSGSAGVGRQNLNAPTIEAIKIPLPPLAEQERIFLKIEELFTKLEAGVAELKQAQAQVKRYRQAVLKCAFEGKLTNESLKEGELPKNWKWSKIGDICRTIDGDRGTNYPKKNEFSSDGYCLFLSTKNVRDGKFVFDENIFISKKKDEILRGGKLELNDVVITTRGTLGNVALYDEKVPYKHIRINSGMLILRIINQHLSNSYLMKFITSLVFISQLKAKQTGTAQPQIPANILREIEVPFGSIEEQEKIVEEVERLLSVADAVEKTIGESLKQAGRLRQSILQKAFTGKLVPQLDADEPASVLLERIRRDNESRTQKTKGTAANQKLNAKDKKPKSKEAAQGNLPF